MRLYASKAHHLLHEILFRISLNILISAGAFAQSIDTVAHLKDTVAQQNIVAAALTKDTVTQQTPPAKLKDTMPRPKPPICRIMLAGKLGLGTDSTSVDEILADPVIRTAGCTNLTITSFELVTNVKNEFHQIVSNNDHLTKEMVQLIKGAM